MKGTINDSQSSNLSGIKKNTCQSQHVPFFLKTLHKLGTVTTYTQWLDNDSVVTTTAGSMVMREYRSDDITIFFFLHFSVLDTMYQWSMMKNIHSPNLVGIGSWGPEIWLHEYLISPTKISVNWPGFKHLWTRPVYTNFNVANWVLSNIDISGHHEPIHVKFGVWGFFHMFYWNMVMKMLKCKKENLMTSHFSTLYCWSTI